MCKHPEAEERRGDELEIRDVSKERKHGLGCESEFLLDAKQAAHATLHPSARRAISRSIPPNTNWWTGHRAYQ